MLSAQQNNRSIQCTHLCYIVGLEQLRYVVDNEMHGYLTFLYDNPEGNADVDKIPFRQKNLAAYALVAL